MISAFPRLTEAQRAMEEQRYLEAAELAMAHVRAHPNEPRGLALLGTAAIKMGALGQGEQFLRKAIEIEPSTATIRELASCLNQQERLPEALDLYRRVEDAGNADPQVGVLIGLVLDKLGRFDEARQKFEAVIREHPSHLNALLAYALNLRAAGRTDECIRAYRQVTEIAPVRGDAWWGLASIKEQVLTPADIASMEDAVAKASDITDVAPLHFALGRAWHGRNEYKKAFHHFSEANRLWAESINYQRHELTDEVEETERLFDRRFFEGEQPAGDPSTAPIFLVSLPRSGSTLLEQMLSRHPQVEALGELPHVPPLLRAIMERAMRHGIKSVPQALRWLSLEDRTALGREYLRRAALHRKTDAPHFIDKLPHNWSNAALIHLILPNAKIIDIRRNPIDCCFSNFTHSFSRVHASSFALGDIGQAYVDYVRYMDHLDQAAPGMIHHVRYEELIDQPERELRRVLDYLDLPWDDAVLRFYESERAVRTPSAEQVRRPINREGIGTWKPYERWLGELLDALGPVIASDR